MTTWVVSHAFCSLKRSNAGVSAVADSGAAGLAAGAASGVGLSAAGFSPCMNFLEFSNGRPREAL